LLNEGIQASYDKALKILEMSTSISYFYVFTGGVMLLMSGIGWIAAQSKSEVLGFLVSRY
jgi:hypothetical protein